MKFIKKLHVKNFKKFADETFEFNEDINILVGDNECGKSSILEAIELCLNVSHRGRPISPEVMAELFNSDCVENYLKGDKSQISLPELLIEAYLDGDPELKGTNNSKKQDTQGISLRMLFNSELSPYYELFIASSEILTVPFELYKIEWMSFAWKQLVQQAKPLGCLFVDPTRLHPTLGRSRYINAIINASVDKNARPTLNLNYRQLKMQFNEKADVKEINTKLNERRELTTKDLKIVADITPSGSWDSNLALTVDDIAFSQIGKGEQNQIQIKVAIQNKAKETDIVMLEEPENHLSHINLIQLVSYIEQKNAGKQIFLTTHSSYVLNKLSINKLCLLAREYVKLKDIDANTVKTLKRLPGYDTLRMILAQKVILVEGPSDELVLKKIYHGLKGRLPEEDGIDIIVVRGIGFKVYLDIAKALEHPVRVVKDNDGNYQKNIIDWRDEDYKDCDFIECFSPKDDAQHSLEPALVAANSKTVTALDKLAKVMLSAQTYDKEYAACTDFAAKRTFMNGWYDNPKKKVDSAIRIFDTSETISYPKYLMRAISFDM
ncbi:MAG: chromosome segregation protein [Syntrophorhabdus sp. PtaU1.Bin058]|nr:MAG: chromosome segregation protein [Syntrophorhabdus sp. PtaU1.Bin058]